MNNIASIGAVKFNRSKILFVEYNPNSNRCYPPLYSMAEFDKHLVLNADTIEQAFGSYRLKKLDPCTCNKPTYRTVHIMVKDFGSWWGTGCSYCERLVKGISSDTENFVEGEPAWSPWLKYKKEILNKPIVPGFSMAGWITDDEEEEKYYENKKQQHEPEIQSVEFTQNGRALVQKKFTDGTLKTFDSVTGEILEYDPEIDRWKNPVNKTNDAGYAGGVTSDDLPF